jgi:hypothetical protein
MGARLPSILVDMNAFFKDESYAGLANTLTLPSITTKMVDQPMSGVAGDIGRDTGKLDKLECQVTISDYASKVIDLIGSRSSRDEVFNVRGAVDVDGAIKTVVVRMQGYWRGVEFNEWAPEANATSQFTIDVEMFEMEIDGKEVIHIDKINNVFRVNGKDRNDEIRAALAQ